MLHFKDAPYEFYPAKPNRAAIRLAREVNRRISLPGKRHRVTGVEVIGGERVREMTTSAKARLVFLANHPTHSDPQVLMEVHRQLGVASCAMAAYDVFLRSRVLAWVMQRIGAFSVDRDGSDRQSMKMAVEILAGGEYGLTMFPEGNVYLTNDRVTPFQEGAVYLAMKAQKLLGNDEPIHVIPVSIKLTHATARQEAIRQVLTGLAKDVGTELDRDGDFLSEVKRIGLVALKKKLHQRGLVPPVSSAGEGEGSIAGTLDRSAEVIVERLEHKMELPPPKEGSSLRDRLRKIRGRIHQTRVDPDRKMDHDAAVTWADEAMMALRVLSYSGDYIDEKPTLDRFAESVEKIVEDAYSEAQPPSGERYAFVRIGEPIDLSERLEAFSKSARSVVAELTDEVESRVQEGLDEVNARNGFPGGAMF